MPVGIYEKLYILRDRFEAQRHSFSLAELTSGCPLATLESRSEKQASLRVQVEAAEEEKGSAVLWQPLVAASPGVSAVFRPSPRVAQWCSLGPAHVHAGRHSLVRHAFPWGMISVVPRSQAKHSEAALGSCHCGRVSESSEPRQVWMLKHFSLRFLSSQDERHPKEAFLSVFIYNYFSALCRGKMPSGRLGARREGKKGAQALMSLAGLPVESGRLELPAQWAVLLEAGWARPCLPGGPPAFPGPSSVQPVVLGAVAMGLPAAFTGT